MNDEERRRLFQSGSKALSRLYPTPSSETAKSSYAALENKKSTVDNLSKDSPTDDESFLNGVAINTLGIVENIYTKPVPFKETKLHYHLLKAFEKFGFLTTNKVQMEVLGFFSEFTRQNLKICAPRKYGKTTAVLMCCLSEILNAQNHSLQFLIVSPTFELAEMCYLLIQKLIQFCSLSICYVVKVKGFKKNEKVKEDIIITTPEKISEIKSALDFRKIRYFFIDDAECCKNLKHISQFCKSLPPQCQMIIAADSENKFIDDFLGISKLLCHDIIIKNTTSYRNIKQFFVVHNHPDEKLDSIVHLLKTKRYMGQTVIFSDKKSSIPQLEEILKSQNIEAVKLYGDLSSTRKQEIIQLFNQKEIQIVITTPAFLRVLNSNEVTQVINTEQIFDSKEGLHLEVYDRRKGVINEKKPGIFISFIEDSYQEFFFTDKETHPNGRSYYHGSEIINVDSLKSILLK